MTLSPGELRRQRSARIPFREPCEASHTHWEPLLSSSSFSAFSPASLRLLRSFWAWSEEPLLRGSLGTQTSRLWGRRHRWVSPPPSSFGIPKFSVAAIISMLIVMAITAVETTGDVFATGEVVGKRITPAHIANALRADGLSTYGRRPQFLPLHLLRSKRWSGASDSREVPLGDVVVLPKAGAVVASIPKPVIGGASLAMFAAVAVVGIQTLSTVDMRDNRNSVIVSTSIGLGLLVTLKPNLAATCPHRRSPSDAA